MFFLKLNQQYFHSIVSINVLK